ncbi:MAG: NADH-quinone oxidoreductase subunit NuoG [Deltaproteobacteria bacterium]|nr:NADH-quinone oxidoreductase subunit NuoG [Deltaproteobacteria bacterium]
MAMIYIDGQPREVERGQNLLQICLSLNINLPYFCWHPALGSVGACRQCAIKQFKDRDDTRGRIVMACMTPAEDGMLISVDDHEARDFRASVIEWLMVNHPHDCPVCDEGGECHLQDMTVMTGHDYREFRFNKRTHRNQDLGPFIHHEMNRCIACYRCVRFYRDYAGGRDFDVFGAHDAVYFGRASDGVLENEFSGNLVEVCPTGVFTDKTLAQHYTRKWDLQTAPSVCVHCGAGCNTIPGERYGTLRRIRNRYNHQVNGYFLCDRGRYGYEFVNSEQRIRKAVIRSGESPNALEYVAALVSKNERLIGIGSPRASLEANFALRALVGSDRFFHGISAADSRLMKAVVKILRAGPARSPSVRDVEQCDAVLILGEDVTNTAPRIALALRQAARLQPMRLAEKIKIPAWNDAAVRAVIQDRKGPFFIAAPQATRLDDLATRTYRAAHGDLARLGFAVAHVLNPEAPGVNNLTDEVLSLAEQIAKALKEAVRPLVVSGTSCGSEAVIHAAANVAWAICGQGRAADLCLTPPECNSLGLALLDGGELAEAFQAVREGRAGTVIVLENDLYRRAELSAVDEFLHTAKHVVALDSLENDTTKRAEVILPAATFAEADGTLVNNEGRAQRFYSVFPPAGEIRESWRWLRDIGVAAGKPEARRWENLDAISAALAREYPIFESITEIAPPAGLRIAGQKIPRQPHRYSGRTAVHAHINVSEPKPPEDCDSPLSFSMEGYPGQPPSALIPRFWAPGWNSVQSVTRFQAEAGGELRGGDPGRRLIEPAVNDKPHYFREIPAAFSPREGSWLVLSIHHIFGSEELSIRSGSIAQLTPDPYVALHPEDAARLGVREGQTLDVKVCGVTRSLPFKPMPSLPRGVAGMPAGLPQLAGLALPAWAKIAVDNRGQRVAELGHD